jgi:hypothetical protein
MAGAAAMPQERLDFVDDKDSFLRARFLEGGGDVLLGFADPARQQIGAALRPPIGPAPVRAG